MGRIRELESEKSARKVDSAAARVAGREDGAGKDRVLAPNNDDISRDRVRIKEDTGSSNRERPRSRDEESSASDSRKNAVKVSAQCNEFTCCTVSSVR